MRGTAVRAGQEAGSCHLCQEGVLGSETGLLPAGPGRAGREGEEVGGSGEGGVISERGC